MSKTKFIGQKECSVNAQPKILSVSRKLNVEPVFVSIQVCRFFQRLSTLLQPANKCVIILQPWPHNRQISESYCLILCKNSCVPRILQMIPYWNHMKSINQLSKYLISVSTDSKAHHPVREA